MVRHCQYKAESKLTDYGDFQVCALHDCLAVRDILDAMKGPAHYWSNDRPIVMPCIATLDETWFEPVEAGPKAIYALDDPKLLEVDPVPARTILPQFDPLHEGKDDDQINKPRPR